MPASVLEVVACARKRPARVKLRALGRIVRGTPTANPGQSECPIKGGRVLEVVQFGQLEPQRLVDAPIGGTGCGNALFMAVCVFCFDSSR